MGKLQKFKAGVAMTDVLPSEQKFTKFLTVRAAQIASYLRQGKITIYDDEILEKLRQVTYYGVPASILLLSGQFCNGHCRQASLLLAQALIAEIGFFDAARDPQKITDKQIAHTIQDLQHYGAVKQEIYADPEIALLSREINLFQQKICQTMLGQAMLKISN